MKSLSGVRVLEIGQSVSGPYAGMILAELGADVIKLEPPGGDPARGWGPPYSGDQATAFATVNRGKRSIVADLRDVSTLARIIRLIDEEIDVVLHNQKADALDRLGLDLVALRAGKPSLIVCELSAYGDTGPYRTQPGYDPVVQAASGLMSILGEEARPPVRVPLSALDMTAGMWAALGVLAALRCRDTTGCGNVPGRMGSGHASIVPTQAFPTSDGWIMIAVGTDAQFARLTEVLGTPKLASDPRFARNVDRVIHRTELIEILAGLTQAYTAKALTQNLVAGKIPCSEVLTVDQVIAHPQTKALQILQSSPDASMTLVGLPLRFDGARPTFERCPPAPGQHQNEVLGQ
jgi:crotonobetainyl-CoA:carnitine CoA-transferase CaiB-like acyl-CoA transferase